MIYDDIEVIYGVYDKTLDTDTHTTSTSSDSDYSDVSTVLNGEGDHVELTYAEQDYFLLDGSFTFPEKGRTDYPVGWESENFADENGNIDEYIQYVYNDTHVNYGIQLRFPRKYPPTSFKITYYRNGSTVGTDSVTNNKEYQYSDSNSYTNWDTAKVEILKVPPYQRARVYSMTFSINDIYSSDYLLKCEASRKTDISGDYTDCGEVSFQFFNDGRFDVTSIKDMAVGLQEDLAIDVYVREHGETDMKHFGHYYSETMSIEEEGQTITIGGYDVLYKLNETTYTKGIVKTQSLGAWAREIASDAGVDISVASAYDSISSSGYISEVSHREALRLITEAANGYMYVDSDNVIQLKILNTSKAQTAVTDDEIVEGTLTQNNSDKTLGVQVIGHTYALSPAGDVEIAYEEEVAVTPTLQRLDLTFSQYPVQTSSVIVYVDGTTDVEVCNSSGTPISQVTTNGYQCPDTYSEHVIIYLKTSSGTATTFVTVVGTPYNDATNTVTLGSETKSIKKIESNYLIGSSLASTVASYQNERVVNKYQYSAEVFTESEAELGDRMKLENEAVFVTGLDVSMEYLKHEVTVEGQAE